MKKSSFMVLIFGTASILLFALGMCMALIAEWNTFKPGIVFGCLGLLLGFITYIVYRKMTHKKPIQVTAKTIFAVIIGLIGILILGLGMCFSMIWDKMMTGIAIGIIGIVILLCLIPFTKGIHD